MFFVDFVFLVILLPVMCLSLLCLCNACLILCWCFQVHFSSPTSYFCLAEVCPSSFWRWRSGSSPLREESPAGGNSAPFSPVRQTDGSRESERERTRQSDFDDI